MQHSKWLKCNAGNTNFGEVPKSSENSKKIKIKIEKKFQSLFYHVYVHYVGNIYNSIENGQFSAFSHKIYTLHVENIWMSCLNPGPAEIEILASW